jgi:hypothetical protein
MPAPQSTYALGYAKAPSNSFLSPSSEADANRSAAGPGGALMACHNILLLLPRHPIANPATGTRNRRGYRLAVPKRPRELWDGRSLGLRAVSGASCGHPRAIGYRFPPRPPRGPPRAPDRWPCRPPRAQKASDLSIVSGLILYGFVDEKFMPEGTFKGERDDKYKYVEGERGTEIEGRNPSKVSLWRSPSLDMSHWPPFWGAEREREAGGGV